jgi:hypothetical protein
MQKKEIILENNAFYKFERRYNTAALQSEVIIL